MTTTAGAVSPAVRGAREHRGEWNTQNRWDKMSLMLSYLGDIDEWHGRQDFREMFFEHAQTAMRWAPPESRSRPAAHGTAETRKWAKSA